jgi:hypothetical protein
MLIKRISKSLMNQNWKEIIVELFVVVVGVFLAIQVDNWNSARGELDHERLLLESLHAEFVDNESIGTGAIERFKEVEAAALRLLEIAEAEQNSTKLELYSVLNDALAIRAPRFNSNTWDVLVSSGQLTILQNARIKETVADFYKLVATYSEFYVQRAENDSGEAALTLIKHLDLVRYVYTLHPEDLPFLQYDSEEVQVLDQTLRAELRNLSIQIWHIARDFRGNLAASLKKRQEIEDRIANELSRFN